MLGNVVEYLHAATLLHDDVLDDAALRRGAPSANRVWGNHLAVLGGDFLYTTAFDLLLASAPREVIRVLCRCSLDMIDGEVLQRRWRNRPDITEETYLAVVARKTASLISGCCRTGALLAGADAARVEALGRFGEQPRAPPSRSSTTPSTTSPTRPASARRSAATCARGR